MPSLKCSLRQWRDVFGAPMTGIHRYRFLGLAAPDYFLALLGAMLWTWLTGVPLVMTTIFILILGEIAHYLFCIPTDALKWLGHRL